MAAALKQLCRARTLARQGHDRETYMDYVRAYHRFGGERRFLGRREFEALKKEEMDLCDRSVSRPWSPEEAARIRELHDLLLTDVDLWADITPEDTPRIRGGSIRGANV
jgi:hypothetical protein